MGVELTAGNHIIEFRYKNNAFVIGLIVSILCLAATLALWILIYKPDLKGRYYRIAHRYKEAKKQLVKKYKKITKKRKK